jgi:omega-6 fatty acid desaturase (delta-12 desaturase)
MKVAVICLCMGLISIFGFLPWLIIKMATIGVASTAGVRLFHAQHQFEDAYWEHADSWDYTAAAMQGSSFYKLPEVLQSF